MNALRCACFGLLAFLPVAATTASSCDDAAYDPSTSCPDDGGAGIADEARGNAIAIEINTGDGFGGSGGAASGSSLVARPIVGSGYVVSGSLINPNNIAIQSVVVGGVPATGGTNFATWNATLNAANLVANREGTSEFALITVTETDVCGGSVSRSTEVRIGPELASSLKLAVSVMNRECYLPASGASNATVVVTADTPDYIDQTLALGASTGSFSPVSPTFQVADGGAAGPVSQAGAVFSVAPLPTGGVTTLVASIPGSMSNIGQIVIAGPPRITPGGAGAVTIPAGDSQAFFVETRGRLAGCYAELSAPTPGSSSSSSSSTGSSSGTSPSTLGGVTISWTPALPAFAWVPLSPDGGAGPCDGTPGATPNDFAGKSAYNAAQVTVSLDPGVSTSTLLTLRCLDSFAQEQSVIINVSAAAATPPSPVVLSLAPLCKTTAGIDGGTVRSVILQAMKDATPAAGATVSFVVVAPTGQYAPVAVPATAVTDANGYAATSVWVPDGSDVVIEAMTSGSTLICDALACVCNVPDGGAP